MAQTQALIHTGATTVKSKVPRHNDLNYSDIYVNDIDATDFIFIPYIDKDTPAVESVAGYTLLRSHITINLGVFYNLDALIEIVGYSPMSFTQLKNHSDVGSRLFFRLLTENSMEEIMAYSSPLAGKCLEDTRKYCNIIPEPEGVGAAKIGSTFTIG